MQVTRTGREVSSRLGRLKSTVVLCTVSHHFYLRQARRLRFHRRLFVC